MLDLSLLRVSSAAPIAVLPPNPSVLAIFMPSPRLLPGSTPALPRGCPTLATEVFRRLTHGPSPSTSPSRMEERRVFLPLTLLWPRRLPVWASMSSLNQSRNAILRERGGETMFNLFFLRDEKAKESKERKQSGKNMPTIFLALSIYVLEKDTFLVWRHIYLYQRDRHPYYYLVCLLCHRWRQYLHIFFRSYRRITAGINNQIVHRQQIKQVIFSSGRANVRLLRTRTGPSR